jgi:hypothetical protein
MSEPDLPHFALVYTSARPDWIAPVLERWFGRACRPECLAAVVCVDAPDADAGAAAVAASAWREQTRIVVNRGDRTCVAGWNEAARHAVGDVMIAVADDFEPPAEWDEALRLTGPAGWWREDRVVAVRDGNVDDVFTLAILTRARWARFGYVFHPAYESLFADTEYTAVACGEQAVLDGRHLLFEHRHHDIGKRREDDVDRRHASRARWTRGEQTFLARQRAGFPPGPTTPLPEPVAPDVALRFAVYVQANKNDFCLAETVRALLAQQEPGAEIGGIYFFCPDEYWSGRATTDEERAQVQTVVAELKLAFPAIAVEFMSQAIAPLRVASRSRVEVETRARNAALAEIRARGYEHILVVDGDELWRPGVLALVTQHIRRAAPPALVSFMVPVVGLPGYPVDRAKDRATVYVGPHASFVQCRTVCGIRQELPGRGILHFTATRRTMDEIVAKHRESGHYDDPDYDFEGWIARVLPQLRPGFKGAHMYRPRQIWPRVRRWSREEFAAIPPTLRPFVGPEIEGPWTRWWRRLRRAD